MTEPDIRKKVTLAPLEDDDRKQFIADNQEAFLYGATQEFGLRDDHFEEEGQIISRKTIEETIDSENAEAWRILYNGAKAGGLVLEIDREHKHGELALLFVAPEMHNRGIGYAAWQAVETMHPEILVWETVTPYFETRNIHFYVNRCGFHIVEFYNEYHPDPNDPDSEGLFGEDQHEDMQDGMFRFVKDLKVR